MIGSYTYKNQCGAKTSSAQSNAAFSSYVLPIWAGEHLVGLKLIFEC